MLELIANNKPLNLPTDIRIHIVNENPLFLEDRIPSPYSLSFEVPLTPENLAIFGNPHRIASIGLVKKQTAEIRHDGIIISRGELLLLEAEKVLKLQFKGSYSNDNFVSNLNLIEGGSYDYGVFPSDYADLDYQSIMLQEYREAMLAQINEPSDYVIAPVKIANVQWDGHEGYFGMKNTLLQYLNYWNPIDSIFNIRFHEHDMHTPIVPFPYLWKTIASAFGNLLESNPFATGDLAKLVTVSFNHPRMKFGTLYWTGFENTVINRIIPLVDNYTANGGNIPLAWDMKSFMQVYPFSKFLKEILKTFCMSAYPGSKWRLELNNDIMDRQNVVSWDEKLVGDLVKTYEEGGDYSFSFSIENEKEDPREGSKPTIKAIFDTVMSFPAELKQTYIDETSNAIYEVTKTLKGTDSVPWITSTPTKSAMNANHVATGKKAYNITSEVLPLEMNIEQIWWDNEYQAGEVISKKHWSVPFINLNELTAAPCIMIYSGMAATFEGEGTYPLLLNHHTDQFGVKRHDLSLLPDGPGGLIETYHTKYKAWVEKDKLRVKGSFRFTADELKRIDMRDKVYLRGRKFYIETMEYDLMHRGIGLVEVSLIEC